MGLLDFITKPMSPEQGSDDYSVFLKERNVGKQSWNYNYRDAYEYYRETGIDPYSEEAHGGKGGWVSKFKHPLSEERYLQDEETKKWFDTIENKFVSEEKVAQQTVERLDYLENMPLNGN
tara:strand:- start:308 stop:667 length:360 start_codon:yes stop_codon:yes gene_type:complete